MSAQNTSPDDLSEWFSPETLSMLLNQNADWNDLMTVLPNNTETRTEDSTQNPGILVSSDTSSEDNSQNPRIIDSSNKKFKCTACKKTFNKKKDLTRHFKAVHAKKIYTCFQCGKEYKYLTNLKRHEKKCLKSQKDKKTKSKHEFNPKNINSRPGPRHQPESSVIDDHIVLSPQPGPSHRADNFGIENSPQSNKTHQNVKGNKDRQCVYCKRVFRFPCEVRRHLKICDKIRRKKTKKNKTTSQSFKCRRCNEAFSNRHLLYLHYMRNHSNQDGGALHPVPWGNGTPPWNDIQEFREVYEANQSLILQQHTRGNVRSIYNYPITNEFTIDEIMQHAQSMYDEQKHTFRLNVEFGLILINTETGECRYFKPFSNEELFQRPIYVSRRHDLERLRTRLENLSVSDYILRQRPNTKWKPLMVTNVRLTVYHLNFTLGCVSVELPNYILKSKVIKCLDKNRKGKLYQDNLCAFRCLATHQGSGKLEERTLLLFNQWSQYRQENYDSKDFVGISNFEFPFFECCFNINLNVFQLNKDGSAVPVYKSLCKFEDTMNLNVYNSHLSYITNLSTYTNKFQCKVCNMHFSKLFNMLRHQKICKNVTKYKYPGGFYEKPKTVFDKLEEYNVNVPHEKRIFPWFCVWDMEAMLSPLSTNNSTKLKWTQEHIPISVSICSNVEGFREPYCIIQEDLEVLVREMILYMEKIRQRAHQLTLECFQEVFDEIDDRLAHFSSHSNHESSEKSDEMKELEKEEEMMEKLREELDSYCQQLICLGFNSQKYDMNLVKRYLSKEMKMDSCERSFTVKRNNNYACMSNEYFKFLDITQYLAPGLNYAGFLKAFDVSEEKGFFPYEWFNDPKKLNEKQLPPIKEWFSSLKNTNVLDDGVHTADENYNKIIAVWNKNNMRTFRDYLIYYNNLDVKPFVEAVENLQKYYFHRNIDIFKISISVPGLARYMLFECGRKAGACFALVDDQNKDLYHTIKQNIIGGPSIVFHRHHEKNKTFIRGNKLKICKTICGFDANALYLYCLGKDMPTGAFVRRKIETNFSPINRDRYLLSFYWMDYINETQKLDIHHKMNQGKEKRIVQSACPTNCLNNTDCDVEPDGGCPQCTEAYYGRQCQYRLECYLGGIDTYRGLLNTTQNGHTCQAWNVNYPQKFNNPNKANEGNYCRKDTIAEDRPWCYTTTSNIRYDFCRIPRCEQQCTAPPQHPRLSLISPAEPGKGFYDGYTALFVCPDNTTIKSVCRSNVWSQISCSDICRWSFNGKEQIALQIGESSNISCPIGHEASNIVCIENNTLSGQPNCKIITCGRPGFITDFHNEENLNGSYSYQDILNITCIQGYESNTTTNYTLFTCNENKTWTGGKPFSCSAISCDLPKLQNNSLITSRQSDYTFKTEINIECEDGYELSGNSHLKCLANKSWSGQFPICIAIECNTSGIETYERKIEEKKDRYFYNDTIHIVCKNESGSLSMTQESFHQCKNKMWDGTFVVCNDESSSKMTPMSSALSSASVGIIVSAAILFPLIILGSIIIYRLRTKSKMKKQADVDLPDAPFEQKGKLSSEKHLKNMEKEVETDSNIVYENPELEDIYYNSSAGYININDLPFYAENEDKIKADFETQQDNPLYEQTIAKEKENTSKNKYKRMYPYDNNRVILDTLDGEGDYINASPIKNAHGITQFIAAQGPISSTKSDFWRMVWQENIHKIVMLTNPTENGTIKCVEYWPEVDSLKCGNITIVSKKTEIFPDYLIRTLQILKNGESRNLYLFHFTTWPDKSVPDDPSTLALFHRVVVNQTNVPGVPTLVHCSAGVGRTGTYIALHFLLEEAKTTSMIYPLACLNHLRQQRFNMIQTAEQYIFLHLCVWEAWKIEHTLIPVPEFNDKYSVFKENSIMTEQFKMLRVSETNKLSFLSGKMDINAKKNRFSVILPVEDFRPYLQGSREGEDYINAVFVKGVHHNHEYIITQSPLPNTTNDFWKLILQEQVQIMVHLDEKYNENSLIYHNNSETKFGQIYVKHISNTFVEHEFVITELEISKGKESRKVIEVTALKWEKGDNCPKSAKYMLNLIAIIDKMCRSCRESPILVYCWDGAIKSGLFCLVHLIISRIRTNEFVVISTTVEHLRKRRPQVISSQEQYEFAYECVNGYLNDDATYSNI